MNAMLFKTDEMRNVYAKKGLNGLYAYLRRIGRYAGKKYVSFGFGRRAVDERDEFYADEVENELHLYYCNRLVSCRNGYKANMLRGVIVYLK